MDIDSVSAPETCNLVSSLNPASLCNANKLVEGSGENRLTPADDLQTLVAPAHPSQNMATVPER
jgi:hypothetical protein